MLGFEYKIFLIDNETENEPFEQFWKFSETHKFAVFQVGPRSELWIQELEKKGLAKDRGGNNYYPNRYTIPFKYVVPQLIKEPEKFGVNVVGDNYFKGADFICDIEVNENILSRCSPESLCLVEEWDMS